MGPGTVFCIKCGESNPKAARFCGKCGVEILVTGQSTPGRKLLQLWWVWLVLGIYAAGTLTLIFGYRAGLFLQKPVSTPLPTALPGDSTKDLIPVTGSVLVSPKDGMEMVYVAAGEFQMGAYEDNEYQYSDNPKHTVTLDAFWIDKTEVTNAMYMQCVLQGPCLEPADFSSAVHKEYYANPAYDDYPVVFVDWDDARTYCRWAGRDLPTEAQWEKAARGPDGLIHPWGNNNPTASLANFGGYVGDTKMVGSYPDGASPYGAMDMAGNVAEWVADWYDTEYYRTGPVNNPPGPVSGDYKVVRGGSWSYQSYGIRTYFRMYNDPSDHIQDIGFRCVLNPSENEE